MAHINEQTTRADLEIIILKNDLEDSLFNGIPDIMAMSTDEIREKITQWIIHGDECGKIIELENEN